VKIKTYLPAENKVTTFKLSSIAVVTNYDSNLHNHASAIWNVIKIKHKHEAAL
jgi:hypothetical protein